MGQDPGDELHALGIGILHQLVEPLVVAAVALAGHRGGRLPALVHDEVLPAHFGGEVHILLDGLVVVLDGLAANQPGPGGEAGLDPGPILIDVGIIGDIGDHGGLHDGSQLAGDGQTPGRGEGIGGGHIVGAHFLLLLTGNGHTEHAVALGIQVGTDIEGIGVVVGLGDQSPQAVFGLVQHGHGLGNSDILNGDFGEGVLMVEHAVATVVGLSPDMGAGGQSEGGGFAVDGQIALGAVGLGNGIAEGIAVGVGTEVNGEGGVSLGEGQDLLVVVVDDLGGLAGEHGIGVIDLGQALFDHDQAVGEVTQAGADTDDGIAHHGFAALGDGVVELVVALQAQAHFHVAVGGSKLPCPLAVLVAHGDIGLCAAGHALHGHLSGDDGGAGGLGGDGAVGSHGQDILIGAGEGDFAIGHFGAVNHPCLDGSLAGLSHPQEVGGSQLQLAQGVLDHGIQNQSGIGPGGVVGIVAVSAVITDEDQLLGISRNLHVHISGFAALQHSGKQDLVISLDGEISSGLAPVIVDTHDGAESGDTHVLDVKDHAGRSMGSHAVVVGLAADLDVGAAVRVAVVGVDNAGVDTQLAPAGGAVGHVPVNPGLLAQVLHDAVILAGQDGNHAGGAALGSGKGNVGGANGQSGDLAVLDSGNGLIVALPHQFVGGVGGENLIGHISDLALAQGQGLRQSDALSGDILSTCGKGDDLAVEGKVGEGNIHIIVGVTCTCKEADLQVCIVGEVGVGQAGIILIAHVHPILAVIGVETGEGGALADQLHPNILVGVGIGNGALAPLITGPGLMLEQAKDIVAQTGVEAAGSGGHDVLVQIHHNASLLIVGVHAAGDLNTDLKVALGGVHDPVVFRFGVVFVVHEVAVAGFDGDRVLAVDGIAAGLMHDGPAVSRSQRLFCHCGDGNHGQNHDNRQQHGQPSAGAVFHISFLLLFFGFYSVRKPVFPHDKIILYYHFNFNPPIRQCLAPGIGSNYKIYSLRIFKKLPRLLPAPGCGMIMPVQKRRFFYGFP